MKFFFRDLFVSNSAFKHITNRIATVWFKKNKLYSISFEYEFFYKVYSCTVEKEWYKLITVIYTSSLSKYKTG